MALGDIEQGIDPAARRMIEKGLGLPPRTEDIVGDINAIGDVAPGATAGALAGFNGADSLVAATGGDPAAPQVAPGHALLLRWADPTQTPNLAAEIMEEGEEGISDLNKIGQEAMREYKIDCDSRSEWMDQSAEAIKLATQVVEQKNYPWENASNVKYPLLTSAVIEFAARAYPALIPGRDVVKGVVYGKDEGTPKMAEDGSPQMQPVQGQPGAFAPVWEIEPGAKRQRADRVGEYMSYQLLEEMEEWDEDVDKMLHILPIVGCHFKKTYFDPSLSRNVSVGVRAEDLVVHFKTKHISRAPRISEEIEFYPSEIEEMIRAGLFCVYPNFDYVKSEGLGEDQDKPIEFIEQHRRIDLDRDGYPEPYIVTIQKSSEKVVRIVANFDADSIKVSKRDPSLIIQIKPTAYYTKFPFIRNPSGGFYDIGFGQLLMPINDAINTTLNMLLDSGHQQTVGGGFIAKGLSMHGGEIKYRMGEFKVVNTTGASLRESIVPLEFAGPSAVLFQLLGWLTDAGKMVANANNVLVGDAQAAQMQPTTVLALIEQGLKVFTGIYKRIYKAQKSEFEKLYRLNWLYMPEKAEYQAGGGDWREITREDFRKASGVCPWSDPSMVSDMQRLGRAQFLETYKDDPYCDPIEIRRRIFDAANIEAPEKIIKQGDPGPDPAMLVAIDKQENERIKTRADALGKMAGAILSLARADAVTGQQRLDWFQKQMDLLQQDVEGLANANEGNGSETGGGAEIGAGAGGEGSGQGEPGGAGNIPAIIPGVEAPPLQ